MKNRKKILFLVILIIGVVGSILFFTNQKKELTIDEILKTDAYNYLSDNVKDFIKSHYEETGELYLTEKNFEGNEAYLNPSYIEYLDSTNKDSYNIIPSVTAYVPKLMAVNDDLPSSFDLRNVNGKNYVTPNKNQENEGLCWAYATASLLETHDLIEKDKSYDSSATLFSEKQMDYALSQNGIIGGSNIFVNNNTLLRNLSEGGNFYDLERALIKKIIGVQDIWNNNNKDKIIVNKPLEPYVVFNKNNVLYEIDDTIHLTNINWDLSNEELKENMNKYIKSLVYNYGGAIVSIEVSNNTLINNILGDGEINVNDRRYVSDNLTRHALQLVGWDDNYEYEFCAGAMSNKYVIAPYYDNNEKICPAGGDSNGNSYPSYSVTGKGAWILKNSWGNDHSYIYLTYDSLIYDLLAIKKYSESNWDNNYHLISKARTDIDDPYERIIDNDLVDNEKIIKIKIKSSSSDDIEIYYNENGDNQNMQKISAYHTDYAGYNTINLVDKNLLINKNSLFKIISNGGVDVELFTSNINNDIIAKTNDFLYSLDSDFPNSEKFLNISVKTETKNVSDNEEISYKIKKNNNYLPVNSYYVNNNKTYYNNITPMIFLNEEYAKKGSYTLEAWKDDFLLSTSLINLDIDYMSINGDGSQSNPWQIENTRHFNMIRNAPKDSYILMNDLDFEFDTSNAEGLFYNSGNGWNSIKMFEGELNGNGKILKNITTRSGIFNYFNYSYNSKCNFSECGIHDLTVDGLKYDINNYESNGGIINVLQINDNYTYNFNNLSAKNIYFTGNDLSGMTPLQGRQNWVGGIIGSIVISDSINDFMHTVLKLDNWYSDINYTGFGFLDVASEVDIGGLVGSISLYGNQSSISFNNMKINAKLNVIEDDKNNIYLSDIIGILSNYNGNISINNIIGIGDYNSSDDININNNAFIGKFGYYNTGNIQINGAKSTLPYKQNDKITITNYEDNLKPYEFARTDYNNYTYYEDQYYVYDKQYDGTVKVSFEDKFNHIDNTIPMLKHFPEEYAEYDKTYSLMVGETKSISDLITKDSDNKKLNVYSEFSCDLDICNNVTDSTIISIPTIQNEYQFTGLKSGSTQLILYDEYSGYLDIVTINVMNGDDYHLTLDYNYDNIIDDSYILTNGNTYGSLPNPNRTGYEFIGWFTERENGSKIEENTIFNNNNDVTLYAHWQINSYTVTFNSNDESSVTSQTIDYNGKVIKPSNPTRDGYTFKYWSLNGVEFDFDTPITSDITLVAEWEEIIESDTLKDILEDNGHTVNNTFVSKFTLGETVTQIKNKLGNGVTIETDKDIIATGAVIKKGNESYTVVIKGDLTGDGRVNSGDLLQMRKYLLEEVNLAGAYKEAGIIESVGNIKSLDLLRLRQYLLDEYEFN